MHEMAMTRDVADIVLDYAKKADARKVSAVYLTIGYARDIVEDLFEGCFAYMTRGTVAEGADLVITRVPLTVRCKQCGRVYHIDVHDEKTWPCPTCGSRDYVLNTGREFFVNNIDIVVGDGNAESPEACAVESSETCVAESPEPRVVECVEA